MSFIEEEIVKLNERKLIKKNAVPSFQRLASYKACMKEKSKQSHRDITMEKVLSMKKLSKRVSDDY